MFKPTLQFQSTHPLRDATLSSSDNCDNFVDFNPRTPYGMRLETPFFVLFSLKFQSTHPLRDATLADSIVNVFSAISIHAPLTGCDQWETLFYIVTEKISIHAPLTGCDTRHSRYYWLHNNFNPRTPYGMRRTRVLARPLAYINFNPRTPYGMRRFSRV